MALKCILDRHIFWMCVAILSGPQQLFYRLYAKWISFQVAENFQYRQFVWSFRKRTCGFIFCQFSELCAGGFSQYSWPLSAPHSSQKRISFKNLHSTAVSWMIWFYAHNQCKILVSSIFSIHFYLHSQHTLLISWKNVRRKYWSLKWHTTSDDVPFYD